MKGKRLAHRGELGLQRRSMHPCLLTSLHPVRADPTPHTAIGAMKIESREMTRTHMCALRERCIRCLLHRPVECLGCGDTTWSSSRGDLAPSALRIGDEVAWRKDFDIDNREDTVVDIVVMDLAGDGFGENLACIDLHRLVGDRRGISGADICGLGVAEVHHAIQTRGVREALHIAVVVVDSPGRHGAASFSDIPRGSDGRRRSGG